MSGRQEILENKSYTPGSPIESVHKYSILDVDNLLEKRIIICYAVPQNAFTCRGVS